MATLVSVRYPIARGDNRQATPVVRGCKQVWKAGDYEKDSTKDSALCAGSSVGTDHVRVHPKVLHSNATSHKWALGELLDNALDEACNGATYVHIDMLENKKDVESKMLLVEDNGGGMSPDKMRACMSLGHSATSKMANSIGQYGNGFKTSTMRLGADVIVFSKSQGNDGKSPTKSIGMLSYTFFMGTGKEDIVVPMIDYEKREQDLLHQFDFIKDQGTCIVIYNLWEDDEGELELDFDTDKHDIQIRGHSLWSYASILYLQLSPNFKMVLRGKEVEHHNFVNDMMEAKKMIYKPIYVKDNIPNDSAMVATVKIGFVKDASHHVDVQGFNVIIKIDLSSHFRGSGMLLEVMAWGDRYCSRSFIYQIASYYIFSISFLRILMVIVFLSKHTCASFETGVLEAIFVEPTHDQQGFERTTVLSRLEARLVAVQKDYWSKNCHIIGYAGSGKREKDNVLSTKGTPSSCPTQNKQGSTIADSKSKLGIRDKLLKHEEDNRKSLELQESEEKREVMDKEQTILLKMLDEERKQRQESEEKLKARLREASTAIDELLEKLK
ncbi:hypothetical protein SLE2022_048590 [Rubroshorea leprosula]